MADLQSECERIDKMLAGGVISPDEAVRLRSALTAKIIPESGRKSWSRAVFVLLSIPLAFAFFFFLFGVGVWCFDHRGYPLSLVSAMRMATIGMFLFAMLLWAVGIFFWSRIRKCPEKHKGLGMIQWFTFLNPLLFGGLVWLLVSLVSPVKSGEKASAETAVGSTQNAAREKARARMKKDTELFSREQLQEIESLYQVANQKWNTEEGKDSLKKLVAKYKTANRTGCAMLYLGQMSKGEERESYLRTAVNDYSDCYYGDGVQVGAYARYCLGWYYAENDQPDKANALFAEIKKDYPDAISHNGKPVLLPALVLPKAEFHTAQSVQTGNVADRFHNTGTFQNNPAAVGQWISVDFVEKIADFIPGKKHWNGDLFLKELTLLPEGKTAHAWQIWTGDYLLHIGGDKSAAKFAIKTMAGKEYMLLEWMNGDVLLRKKAPCYYVLERKPQNP